MSTTFDQANTIFTNPAIAYSVAIGVSGGLLIIAILILVSQSAKPSTDASDVLPSAGLRNQVFKTTRASLRQWVNSSQTLAEGYSNFSKNGRSFTTPDLSHIPKVVLPQEHTKWLTAQSDSVLSPHRVRAERAGIEYLSRGVETNKVSVKYIHAILGRFLTRNLDYIQADTQDEIRAGIDAALGLGEEWHQAKLGKTMKTITDRTGCRILFGGALFRDKAFMHSLDRFNLVFGLADFTVGHTPWFIRPIVAALINLPWRFYMDRAMQILVPFIRARMQDITRKKQEGPQKDEPSDFVTQSVKLAMESKDYTFGDNAEIVAEQFLFLAFATLFTNPTVATHVFLDILNTAPELNAYQSLREEAAEAFRYEADWTDPSALQKLVRTDSAIRESLRHSPLAVRGVLREVMPKDGLTLPDGKKVARGTWIGIPVQALQMDARFYERPEEYDPFRFTKTGDTERLEATRISDTFLSFSYGRTACPGRWFAVHLLKLLVAYITLNYDMEPVEERPKNLNYFDANFPSFSTRVRVRRRKQTMSS